MRARALGQRLQLAQVLAVEGIGAADGHRHAVQRRPDSARRPGRARRAGRPAGVHEVLGEDLEPVDRGPLLRGCGRSGRCAGRRRRRGREGSSDSPRVSPGGCERKGEAGRPSPSGRSKALPALAAALALAGALAGLVLDVGGLHRAPRSRPCPCRSSCPRSRCRRSCSRPGPCTRSCPCSRAWPRPTAQPPLPLHAFLPAQPCVGLAAPLPLHALWPLQMCLSPSRRPSSLRRRTPCGPPAMPATTAPITLVNSLRSICSPSLAVETRPPVRLPGPCSAGCSLCSHSTACQVARRDPRTASPGEATRRDAAPAPHSRRC